MIGRLALTLVLAATAAGCPRRPTAGKGPAADPFPGTDDDDVPRLRRELEGEILDSYARLDGGEVDSGEPRTLAAIIGIGADEVPVRAVRVARKRWPFGGEGWARSKLLEVYVTDDGAAAWAFDEVSWRLEVCGRTAVVPLRYTALYTRDGDRWAPVFEHLAYPQRVGVLIERGPVGTRLEGRLTTPAVAGVETTIERALTARSRAEKAAVFAASASALVLWPDPAHELRGTAVITGPGLAESFDASGIELEGFRSGVTSSTEDGAVAWWVGTLTVAARRIDARETEAVARVRLRASFVLERHAEVAPDAAKIAPDGGATPASPPAALAGKPPPGSSPAPSVWRVVQAHVSAPASDSELATYAIGSPYEAGSFRCDDALQAPVPTVGVTPPAPPPAVPAPAAGSP